MIVQTGPANQRDDRKAFELIEQFPQIAGRRGRPRWKPTVLQGDAGYGFPDLIAAVKSLGIQPQLKPRGKAKPSGSGLGTTRHVVERTLSWFSNFKRLRHCWERIAEHFQALHELAACLILANRVHSTSTVVK